MNRAALLFLLVGAGVLNSCAALLPTYGGKPPKSEGTEIAPEFPYHDYRGVIHCHSYLSHDSKGTEKQIAAAANTVGLDFLIMTDHYDRSTDPAIDKAIRGMRGQTLFIPGVELRKDGGSLLVLGAEKNFDPKASSKEITEEIHRQGGLVFIAHLEEYRGNFDSFPYDGVELYNLHAAAKRLNPLSMIISALFFSPNIVFKTLSRMLPENIQTWESCCEKRPIPICAGNDAHANVKIFGPLGGTIGTYEEIFRTVTTHVWANALTQEEILKALKEGRSYISFDSRRDATGFCVIPHESEGKSHWKIFSPHPARIVAKYRGKVLGEAFGQWLEIPFGKPDESYRVEVYLDDKIWIVAGPFVAPPIPTLRKAE